MSLGRAGAAVVVSVVAVLLVGCSAIPRSVIPQKTVIPPQIDVLTTPTPTVTPSASPVTPSVPSEPPEPIEAEPVICDVVDLTMNWVPDPDASGMGHGAFRLEFTNNGKEPCILDGHPGLVAIDHRGQDLGDHGEPNTYFEGEPVTVPPAGVATVDVYFSRPGLYDCTVVTAAGLRAYMPVTGDGIFAEAPIEACLERVGPLFSIKPFTVPS